MRTVPQSRWEGAHSETKANSDFAPITTAEVHDISGITVAVGEGTIDASPLNFIIRMTLCTDNEVGSAVVSAEYSADGVGCVPIPDSDQYVALRPVEGLPGATVTVYEIRVCNP